MIPCQKCRHCRSGNDCISRGTEVKYEYINRVKEIKKDNHEAIVDNLIKNVRANVEKSIECANQKCNSVKIFNVHGAVDINEEIKEVIEVRGDGNCFFRCISYFIHNTEERHGEIRKEIISFMRQHEEKYSQYVFDEPIYETYLQKMACNGEYGDQATIFAASELYGKSIHVQRIYEDSNKENWEIYPADGCVHRKDFIVLRHSSRKEHFNVLKMDVIPCICKHQQDKGLANVDSELFFGKSLQEAEEWIDETYRDIVFWKQKNLFEPPNCKATKSMIRVLSNVLQEYISNTPKAKFALKALMILPVFLLQKPQKHIDSKTKNACLSRRVQLLENGQLDDLKNEIMNIQKSLKKRQFKNSEDECERFGKFMKKGKVKPAIRIVSKEKTKGPLEVTQEIRRILQQKHPKAKEDTSCMEDESNSVLAESSLFDNINCKMVWKTAIRTQGSGGPSGLSADILKVLLSKKRFGDVAVDFQRAIAMLAKKLATEKCQNVDALVASRLLPLDKNPGVRPIGIGEVIMRVIGKMIMRCVKNDVKQACGNLQLCAGHKAGGEAAIHAMRRIFEEDNTEAVLLVDADNAFNCINRHVMLRSIKHKCPSFYQYVANTYGNSSSLFISGGNRNNKKDIILSEEGTRQGDPIAMAMYAIGISELQSTLAFQNTKVKSAAYADDYFGAGSVQNLLEFWKQLLQIGPELGYFPNAGKTCLIVKKENEKEAIEVFQNTGVEISSGKCHLGAVVGSNQFKLLYMEERVTEWIDELRNLSRIAKKEPHAAYTAFTFGLKHKWTYITRTVPNIENMLQPLEEVIRKEFIPAITNNHTCSDMERNLLALPPRLGGLGIINPTKMAATEFENSTNITSMLTELVINQDRDGTIDEDILKQKSLEISHNRKEKQNEELASVLDNMSTDLRKRIECAQETGASNWLTSLPIKANGFSLNKQEFKDALALRYGWKVEGLPDQCACGKPFDANHAMICPTGGFIVFRHNEVRDITASMLKEVCRDVTIEPVLLPLTGEKLKYNSAMKGEEAKMDISARNFWEHGLRTFLDVRIFNPLAPSHRDTSLSAVHIKNEKEKQRKYGQRIRRVEQCSFTPLVFSMYGGMSKQTKSFYKRLADLKHAKSQEELSYIVSFIRCSISFSLLRSSIICLRGGRSTSKGQSRIDFNDIDMEHVVMQSGCLDIS